MNLELHIDRLITDDTGIRPRDLERVRVALAAELGRLLADRGPLPALSGPADLAGLRLAAPHLRPGAGADALGRDLARALYRALGGRP